MHKVKLNIYDFTNGTAATTFKSLLGIEVQGLYQTAVVVHDVQFYYEGKIGWYEPNNNPLGKPINTIEIGFTQVSKQKLLEQLKTLRQKYRMQNYDMMQNNSNDFSNELCNLLTGKGIPAQLIEAYKKIFSNPIVQKLKPELMQKQEMMKKSNKQ